MAKHCWPGERALGKRMHAGNRRNLCRWATVVGVVTDTKLGAPDEPSNDQWYTPVEQPSMLRNANHQGNPYRRRWGIHRASIRAADGTDDSIYARQRLRGRSVVGSRASTDHERSNRQHRSPATFDTSLITSFALCALSLVITGFYAVVAFSVSLQTGEIAIGWRLAPTDRHRSAGAHFWGKAGVSRLRTRSSRLSGFVAAGELILFKVSATDPQICLAAAEIMVLITLLASTFPATRAASAEPIDALRSM